MKNIFRVVASILLTLILMTSSCTQIQDQNDGFITMSKEVLKDKIKGAWAAQTIGVTYGGPTEFRYLKRYIPDSVDILWTDTTLLHMMTNSPGLYDDIYMDLTFVEVMEREGLNAPASSHAQAFANAKYWLWHANQQARYNILHGISPLESGHWKNNPHADDIDFQIEADFAGIMNPGMPNSALEICDRVGHIMNYGDGYYGGVFVAGMYSYAFIENDISLIVNKGISMIPEQSTFYQCIADVIIWHRQYPNDWKKNWQKIEDKWGTEVGCPDGVFEDFNIDAKINAAYVVLGLLYGGGDISKTMEISTRAGQDSDCNPATAGAIIGTIQGYDKIPEYWTKGLSDIEDMDFMYTTTSLNDVYKISYKHALALIEKNGGEINESDVKIKIQNPMIAPLEQSFPDYALADNLVIDQKITLEDSQELELDFTGIGFELKGRARHMDFDERYALISNEGTLNGYRLNVEFTIDNGEPILMDLPLSFVERAHEIFYQYELPEGQHKLKMKILNPDEKVYLELQNMITYRNIEK